MCNQQDWKQTYRGLAGTVGYLVDVCVHGVLGNVAFSLARHVVGCCVVVVVVMVVVVVVDDGINGVLMLMFWMFNVRSSSMSCPRLFLLLNTLLGLAAPV